MIPYGESKERRANILGEYKAGGGMVEPWMARVMVEYDRYDEAGQILEALEKDGLSFKDLSVVDYGAGAGDYGFAFGRQGAHPIFYDFKVAADFIRFRAQGEGFEFDIVEVEPGREMPLPAGWSGIVIFGEVLEHLDDPLATLQYFTEKGAKYIFTSSYPYRRDAATDDYWKKSGHSDKARLQQPACRELLEKRYKKIANFGGQLNLWKSRVA